MTAKFKNTKIVYSTNPDFNDWEEQDSEVITLPPNEQKLIISLDKKQRKGKKVTLVKGFVGSDDKLKELGKLLKTKCGVGGSVKDNEVIIQGDLREKVVTVLSSMGYNCKIKG
ncbi:MAG: translation initiation factor [Bacteroidetes bacterium]|nr:translation initiation factor [Bacteroidota bacterium]MBL6943870.1 translation initiation factor [Bacteroidales bacterium]